ncbi:Hypothetical protein KVN_LOCUS222 [uncultured virus]|nr:Hypothetical protein KVN_LOCUS222 [uncultured virus]
MQIIIKIYLKEINLLMENQIKNNLNLKDIDDILQATATIQELDDFKNQLSNLDTDQLNQLFLNMSKNNKINPNNNIFHAMNQKAILKLMYKNKINNMKNNRIQTKTKEYRQQKSQDKNLKKSIEVLPEELIEEENIEKTNINQNYL